MSIQRRLGLGVTLSVDIGGSNNYVSLGGVVNMIKHGGTNADVADLSILSDTFKQKGKGQIDPGEITLECAYDPGDDAANQANTTQRLQTMHDATGVYGYPFRLTLPAIASPGSNSAENIDFSAHLTSMGLSIEKDKLIVTPITLTITGDPGL